MALNPFQQQMAAIQGLLKSQLNYAAEEYDKVKPEGAESLPRYTLTPDQSKYYEVMKSQLGGAGELSALKNMPEYSHIPDMIEKAKQFQIQQKEAKNAEDSKINNIKKEINSNMDASGKKLTNIEILDRLTDLGVVKRRVEGGKSVYDAADLSKISDDIKLKTYQFLSEQPGNVTTALSESTKATLNALLAGKTNEDIMPADIDRYVDLANKGWGADDIDLGAYKTPEEKAVEEEKVAEETATNEETAITKVQEVIGNLGLTDRLSQDAIDYLSDELAGGRSAYEIEAALKGTPEYAEYQSELQKAKAKEEAGLIQEELGTQLQTKAEEGLAAMTPRIEQTYKRLGGTNRDSTAAALATAAKGLQSERQNILGQAGIESMIQQAGFNREDYLNTQNVAYQQAMQQYQQDYQNWLIDKQTSSQIQYQKALYPLQMAATRQGQAFQVDQTKSARQYQDFWQNQQRQWAKEDQDFYKSLQKSQNWANLFGTIGGVGLGGVLGSLSGKGIGFGKGALSALTGYNSFSK